MRQSPPGRSSALAAAAVAAGLAAAMAHAVGPSRAVAAPRSGAGGAGAPIAYLRFTEPFWQVWVLSADGREDRQATRSPGDKMRVSWFPGGRRLLYNVAPGQVWTVDLDNGVETRVALEMEGTTDAQVSPDGDWIAFSAATGGGIDNNDLWVARADGSQARRLYSDRGLQHFPAWSPDGKELLFLSGEGRNDHDVYRMEVAGGAVTRLSSGLLYNFDLAVSSGRRIAFSSNRSGDYDIWVMEWDGTAARAVAPAPGFDAHPSWSPDGRRLLFTSTRDGAPALWIVGEDGRGLRRITARDARCRAGVFGR